MHSTVIGARRRNSSVPAVASVTSSSASSLLASMSAINSTPGRVPSR